jgi:hypothetical protein
MTTMTIRRFFVLCAVSSLTLVGCDSKQENQREATLEKKADALENQADATRKAHEKQADAIESSEKKGLDKLNPNTPADKEADAVRKTGEAKADRLEEKADAVRDQK